MATEHEIPIYLAGTPRRPPLLSFFKESAAAESAEAEGFSLGAPGELKARPGGPRPQLPISGDHVTAARDKF